MVFHELRNEFIKRQDPARAKILAGFFKCGKEECAEGGLRNASLLNLIILNFTC